MGLKGSTAGAKIAGAKPAGENEKSAAGEPREPQGALRHLARWSKQLAGWEVRRSAIAEQELQRQSASKVSLTTPIPRSIISSVIVAVSFGRRSAVQTNRAWPSGSAKT